MYGLVAAHIAQLIFNWHNDALVLRQRVNIFGGGSSLNGEENHEPPEAIPAPGVARVARLIVAVVVLGVTLKFKWDADENDRSGVCHSTHAFGAIAGLLTGCIFLRVRGFSKRPVYLFKRFLLLLVYGAAFCVIIARFYHKSSEKGSDTCSWMEYERVCQDQCYLFRNSNDTNCTVNVC